MKATSKHGHKSFLLKGGTSSDVAELDVPASPEPNTSHGKGSRLLTSENKHNTWFIFPF